ncbi:MAG: sugar ABC transporter permease [Chloroflexi bacterium CFX4]|nr:sugar ABC transporter permease [Chloroflexi bacterium CFX4]MDL1921623.1 sugar ABC transporter permease [Chloroflexi bacterium CFX3]
MTNLSWRAKADALPHTFSSGRNYRWLPLWFLLPSIVVLLALQVYPTLYSVYLSTTRVRRGEFLHVGLANFERLLQTPSFWESLRVSLTYSLAYITLTVSIGLMLALLLNRRFKFTGVYLVIIFIPWVISEVVAGTMWRWLFQPTYGLAQAWINTYLPFLGEQLYTTSSGALAIVIAAAVWRGLAFTTLLSLGALQTVPQEIIESASLDGANRFQRFFGVILPQIRSTVLVMVLLTSIQSINSVGLIFSITRGGPGGATRTAAYYLLQIGWEQGDFGTGAAVSVILFLINMSLTILYLSIIGRRRD